FAQECTLGDIKMFAGNFAPRNYALAHGQILQINQNQSLYSLFGTMYGGDGRTSFALPDLRGRAPMGAASNIQNLTPHAQGAKVGAETTTLVEANLPSHTHVATTTSTLRATDNRGNRPTPAGNVLANDGNDQVYAAATANTDMMQGAVVSTTTVGAVGGSPVNNMQPALAINYIVCMSGLFPSRN
ncbi:MAG: tail fiber protein, partial [Pseudomonadota bacterium]